MPFVLAAIWGVLGVLLFVRRYGRGPRRMQGRALAAYAAVVLTSNVAYMLFAFLFVSAVGAS
jgi:hypothetical protein